MLNHGSMWIILFVAFALTGCAVATGSRNSALITSSHSAASISLTRIGGSTDRWSCGPISEVEFVQWLAAVAALPGLER
jgi:hypothetical protein